MEFEAGKRYRFSKEKFKKDLGKENVRKSVNYLDGKEIRVRKNAKSALLEGCKIIPEWCEVIE